MKHICATSVNFFDLAFNICLFFCKNPAHSLVKHVKHILSDRTIGNCNIWILWIPIRTFVCAMQYCARPAKMLECFRIMTKSKISWLGMTKYMRPVHTTYSQLASITCLDTIDLWLHKFLISYKILPFKIKNMIENETVILLLISN